MFSMTHTRLYPERRSRLYGRHDSPFRQGHWGTKFSLSIKIPKVALEKEMDCHGGSDIRSKAAELLTWGPPTFASNTEIRSPNSSKTDSVVGPSSASPVPPPPLPVPSSPLVSASSSYLCSRSKTSLTSVRVCRASTTSMPLRPESVAFLFLITRVFKSTPCGSVGEG